MLAFGPAVGQHQPLQVGVAHRLDAHQVAHFALGPIGGRHHLRDAVHLRVIGRQLGEHAAEQVVAVEGEIVRDQELAGKRPVIRADADDVAGIQVAENVLADGLHGRAVHEDEQAAVAGQVGAMDGWTELRLELLESFASDHGC